MIFRPRKNSGIQNSRSPPDVNKKFTIALHSVDTIRAVKIGHSTPLALARHYAPPRKHGTDLFTPSLPRPTLFYKRPPQPIPDADKVANDPTLHGIELNRAINRTYIPLAEQLQKALGGPKAAPSWYAMAIYASRGAGKGMLGAARALEIVEAVQRGEPLHKGSEELVETALQMMDNPRGCFGSAKPDLETKMAVGFALGFGVPDSPRTLATMAMRTLKLVREQDGPLLERFRTLANTAANLLEDGNRRIFRSIGVAAQRYLELRQKAASVEQVRDYFARDKDKARELYEQNLRQETYPESTEECLAVGFALYEKASRTQDTAEKNRLINMGSNLMAYHEQKTVAVPAFLPGQTLPGEADREKLMEILTPLVDVENRWGTWTLAGFDPDVNEHNWALFEHRWPPILNYFGICQQRPADLWPMPCADPAQPLNP